MYVYNGEKRLIILGDGIREGRKPPQGTKLYPGQTISIEDVPKAQRDRFILCVKRQIEKGLGIQILDAPMPTKGSADAAKRAHVAAQLEKLDALAPEPEPDPEPLKRGPGRPRKSKPLGG